MTKKKIQDKLMEVSLCTIREDDESAHALDDALREAFLVWLAKRKDDIGRKARILLTSNDMNFSRWCG